MSSKLYWKQKIPLLILNGAGMAALTVFLLLNGINGGSMILILSVWGTALAGYLAGAYFLRKAQMDKLLSLSESFMDTVSINLGQVTFLHKNSSFSASNSAST